MDVESQAYRAAQGFTYPTASDIDQFVQQLQEGIQELSARKQGLQAEV